MVDVEKFADELVKLSVVELIDLKKVLKEKYGLEINEAMATTKTEEKTVEVVEEKTSFTVKLIKVSEVTSEKLNAVKVVNRILDNIGLKAAMDLIKEPPVLLKEGISKTDAETIRAEFNALNAVVELS
jgi:large subunit ribosomal protein L7/L12